MYKYFENKKREITPSFQTPVILRDLNPFACPVSQTGNLTEGV
jgi:hypothetical protein